MGYKGSEAREAIMSYVQSVDLTKATLINIVKTVDGIERHYRIEGEAENPIQVVFVARPSARKA